MAEFVAVPQHILYRLPEGLAFEHAALVEPFAIALHAMGRVPVRLNDAVVVAGCGRLLVVDVADGRLALAKKFGATNTINSAGGNAAAEILDLTEGRGADLAFEAAGVTATVDLALGCLRKGGRATLVGNVWPKIEFPLQTAVTRDLTIHGSCASRGEYPAGLDRLGRGGLQAGPLPRRSQKR